jgi:hypothetical protein
MTKQISMLTAVVLFLGMGVLSATAQMWTDKNTAAPAASVDSRSAENPFMDSRIEDWGRETQRRADPSEAPVRRKSLFNE